MLAIKNPQVAVVCHAALNKYKKPIIVDMTGRKLLADVAGRDCVRVTPPGALSSVDTRVFKLEKFQSGRLIGTSLLQAVNGTFFVV